MKKATRTIVLEVIEARNLSARDRSGAADPFVVIHAVPKAKTKSVKKSLDPVWKQRFTVTVDEAAPSLVLEVFHRGITSAKSMGVAAIPLSDLSVARREQWYQLRSVFLSSSTAPQPDGPVLPVSGELHVALCPATAAVSSSAASKQALSDAGSSAGAPAASGTAEDSALGQACSTAATATSSTGTSGAMATAFSVVDVEGSETAQAAPQPALVAMVRRASRADATASSVPPHQPASTGGGIGNFIKKTLTELTSGSTTSSSSVVKPPAPSPKEKEPATLSPAAAGAAQSVTSPTTTPSPASARRAPPGKRLPKRPGRPPTSLALRTNGLVESFFVVGHGDILAELDERFSQQPIDDPFSLKLTGEILEAYPWLGTEELPPSIWLFCTPGGFMLRRDKPEPSIFPFVLTSANGKRNYVTCLTEYEQLEPQLAAAIITRCKREGDSGTPTFAPRCYCVLSSVPVFTFFRQWLRQFHALAVRGNCGAAGEHLVGHLLKAVPMPRPGAPPIRVRLGKLELPAVWLPPSADAPLLDVPLKLLFRAMKLGDVMQLFRGMCLEEKIVLASRNSTMLTLACEALSGLFHPLQWSHVYIPILPQQLSDYIHSPTPYIIGISEKSAAELTEEILRGVLFVNLDTGSLRMPEAAMAELPAAERAVLAADLKEVCISETEKADALSWEAWRDSPITMEDFNWGVRAAFLRFFCSLLRGFRSFFVYVRVFASPIAIFDKKAFLKTRPAEAHAFLNSFLSTQAFASFLDSNSWPRTSQFSEWMARDAARLPLREVAEGLRRVLPKAPIDAPILNLPSPAPASAARSTAGTPTGATPQDGVPSFVIRAEAVVATSFAMPNVPAQADDAVAAAFDLESETPPLPLPVQRKEQEAAAAAALRAKVERVVVLLTTGEAEKVDQADATTIMEGLKTEEGREALARSLLMVSQPSPTPTGSATPAAAAAAASSPSPLPTAVGTKLGELAYGLLGDLCRGALREAHLQKEIHTPRLFLEVGERFYRILDGAEDFVIARLRNLDVWQNGMFWEDYFFVKAGEACRTLYAPSVLGAMKAWSTGAIEQEKRAGMIGAEQEALFRVLADFAFKMTNLAVTPATIRRFAGKMCTAAGIDEERKKLLLQLVYNMSKLKLRETKEDVVENEEAQSKLGFRSVKGHGESWVPIGISNADSNSASWHFTFSQLLVSDTRPLMRNVAKAAAAAQSRARGAAAAAAVPTLPSNANFVPRLLEGHSSAVLCLAHFPMHIASGSADMRIRVWDTRNATCVAVLQNHANWVNVLEFDSIFGRLLSGSYDRVVKLWDLGRMTKIRSLRAHKAGISCIRAHPRGIITAANDAAAILWDVRSKRTGLRLEGHLGPITCLAARGDDALVTGSRDSTVRVWDLRMPARTVAVMSGHSDWVRCCLPIDAPTPGKWQIVTGGYDGRLILWDPETGTSVRILGTHDGTVNALCPWSHTPGTVVSVGADGLVKIWNAHTQRCERVLEGHADEITAVTPFLDRFIASSCCDSTTRVWDPSIGSQPASPSTAGAAGRSPLRQTLCGHTMKVTTVCVAGPFSLATASWDSTVRLWDFSQDFR